MGDSEQAMWERPWTTDELRQNCDNWSLAGDAGLLNHLQKLSESLLSRTHEVQKEVDSLVRETKLTNARMGIAVNDFLMLSNTQFVENRVYDEEMQEDTPTDEKKQDDQEKTKEQREQDLIPRITDALRKGLLVVNDAFEKMNSTEFESESELGVDTSYQRLPILQPKDYYQHRPLPLIIGSDRFMRDDTVGLGEVVSAVEVAESENGTEQSVAESKEEKSEEGTDDVSASEEEYPQQAPSKIKSIMSSNEWTQKEDDGSDGEDLFSPDGKMVDDEADSDSEEEITIATANRNGPVDFASELAAKLNITVHPAKNIDSEVRKAQDPMDSKKKSAVKDEGSSHASSRKSSRKNSDIAVKSKVPPNTVPVEAEEEEADNSPFTKKGGLFSGGGGLFDDLNDEDSDLFSDVPKTNNKSKKDPVEDKSSRNRTRSSRKSSSGSTGAFEDDADLFVTRKESKSSVKDGSTVKTAAPKKGLFDNDEDDDDDDDDDLFSKLSTRKKSKASLSDRKNTSSSLFGEENGLSKSSSKPLVDKEKSVSSKESTPKKKPAGAVSMFGPGVNPLAAAIRAHHRMSDSDKEDVDDNDWSDSEKARPGSRSSKSSVSATSSKVESKLASRSNSVSSNSTSLFAEEAGSSDLFATTEKDTKPKVMLIGGVSLFDDDLDEDDDLFNTPTISKVKSPEKSSNKDTLKHRTSSKLDAQDSLFGGTSSKARKSSGSEPLSSDELPNVSVDVVTKPKERDKIEEEKHKAPKKVSLFDDDEEEVDESDLFVSPAKLSQDKDSLKEPVVKVRSRSLFDEEDVLFGGPQEEAPSVDLFKTSDAESSKKALGKPPIPTPRKASLPKEEPKSSVSDEHSLQGDLEKTVENTPSSVTRNNQDEVDVPSPKKKPIGGVSLFGGLDPFGSKVSRSRSSSEVTESTSKGSPKKEAAFKITPPSSPSSSDSIVMKRPSLKDTKEASVSFDDPAEANTLHSANKERAKIQVKRRPPSRKGRQEASRKSGIFVDDDTDSKASLEEASSSSFTSSPLTPEGGDGFTDAKRRIDPPNIVAAGSGKECNIMSPSTEEEDMFAIGDHVGLMTHIPERTSANKLSVEDDLFTNDTSSKTNSSEESANMFGTEDAKKDTHRANVLNVSDKKSKNHKVTNSTVSKSKVHTNDIFEDGSSNEEDLFSSRDSRKKSLSRSKHKDDDDDDDLFSSASKPSTKKPTSVDLFADDDDLFNPRTIKVEKNKSKLEANSLFADEPKDDIFADLKPTKKAAVSSASKTKDSKKNIGKSIFDDDDDDDTVDLFNDPALVKKK